MFMKFLGEVSLRIRNIRLDCATVPGLNFEHSLFGIKLELKELQMNVYDVFRRGRHSDNEQS